MKVHLYDSENGLNCILLVSNLVPRWLDKRESAVCPMTCFDDYNYYLCRCTMFNLFLFTNHNKPDSTRILNENNKYRISKQGLSLLNSSR